MYSAMYSDGQAYGTMYSDDYCKFLVQCKVMVQYTIHLWYNVKWWTILLYIYGAMYSDGPLYFTFIVHCTVMVQSDMELGKNLTWIFLGVMNFTIENIVYFGDFVDRTV